MARDENPLHDVGPLSSSSLSGAGARAPHAPIGRGAHDNLVAVGRSRAPRSRRGDAVGSRGVVPSGLTVLAPRDASRGPETSETRLVGSGLGGLSRDETAAAPRNAPRAD